jgi:TetR/AcrR family transcriptional regulator
MIKTNGACLRARSLPIFFITLATQRISDKMAVESRKQREKQERYRAILEAAEEIIQTEGLNSLNMDMVAKKTELAKGTLYLYFKSKEEIIASLSIKARKMLLNHYEKNTRKFSKSIDQLLAICTATFSFHKKYPIYFDLIGIYEVNKELEITEEMQGAINNIFNLVIDIINKSKADGYLNPKLDVVQFGFCYWGILIGMVQLIRIRNFSGAHYHGFTEKEIISTFMTLLEEGARK